MLKTITNTSHKHKKKIVGFISVIFCRCINYGSTAPPKTHFPVSAHYFILPVCVTQSWSLFPSSPLTFHQSRIGFVKTTKRPYFFGTPTVTFCVRTENCYVTISFPADRKFSLVLIFREMDSSMDGNHVLIAIKMWLFFFFPCTWSLASPP